MAKKKIVPMKESQMVISEDTLYRELSLLIAKSKEKAVSQVKSTINILFWQVGKRINDEIMHNKRAGYGTQIIPNLARKLSSEYGRSFEEKNLRRMMQFAEQFHDKKIVVPLARQLSWSHIILLLPLKTIEEKKFYAQLAIEEGGLNYRITAQEGTGRKNTRAASGSAGTD